MRPGRIESTSTFFCAAGCCQLGPNLSTTPRTALPFSRLYTSKFARRRARPIVKLFDSRTLTSVRRSKNSVYGETSGTAATAVHTTRVPHRARLRPSEGAIAALGAR